VISVDFEAHTDLESGIYDEITRNTRQRFGQRNRRTAMQNAPRLFGAVINGHGPDQKIIPHFRHFDPEMLHHTAFAALIDLFEWIGSEPNCHFK
jgi:hypothetical protein